MAARIGVGIIGLSKTGWASRAHLPALRALPGFELRGLATSSRASAAEAAEQYGVPLFFDDPAALAARPEIDLVVVAVKVPHHKALVEAALGAGKMVYCEWPLGRELGEAEGMAALAKAKGIPAFVGLQGHAAPSVRYVRDLVASGYVGEVLSTSAIASSGSGGATVEPRGLFGLDRAAGVSMLTIQFGHALDGLCWSLGEFAGLAATLANRRPQVRRTDTGAMVPKTTWDQVAITGTLAGGAVASAHFRAGLSRGTNFLWEINGTEGDLVMRSDAAKLQYGHFTIHGGKGGDKEVQELAVPDSYRLVEGSPGDLSYAVAHAYARLLSDLREGTRNVPTFADAIVRHRMLEAVESSAATGRRTSYDPVPPG